jgi:hypothetical protein
LRATTPASSPMGRLAQESLTGEWYCIIFGILDKF